MRIRNIEFDFSRTYIMGILNVTPDSFSDGGKYKDSASAVDHALRMTEMGADIIDIGGESTRPGAGKVNASEELARVMPVIEGIREKNEKILISADTYKAQVAEQALKAGAVMINDISGGVFDTEIMKITAKYKAAYVIMHMQGTPGSMQDNPSYSDAGVINDIKEFFSERIDKALFAGIRKEALILDPGIGFGKTPEHNFEIINRFGEFKVHGYPLLAGISRKSFIGMVTGKEPGQRIYGTAAAAAICAFNGADIIRVHDVAEMKDALLVADAVKKVKI